MTACFPPSRTDPHAEYRRRARRIRSAFATEPGRRMHALRELAHRHDAARAQAAPPSVAVISTTSASTFARLVRERMDGPVLRYTHRTRLLRDAARRGIGRFEANLIIAAVQHQFGQHGAVPQSRRREPSTLLLFALVQSTLALGAYLLLR